MESPKGLAPNFIAPFSGQLSTSAVTEALAKLPAALNELRARWLSINSVRTSGLMPTFEGGPLDDAVRDGAWNPDLQVDMPMAGGYPGSRGAIQMWPYDVCKDVGFDSGLKNIFLKGGANNFSEGQGNTCSEGLDDAARATFSTATEFKTMIETKMLVDEVEDFHFRNFYQRVPKSFGSRSAGWQQEC